MGTASSDLTGGCGCGQVRYELTNNPLFVHCCHCTWCQRESGSAFALNALIETTEVNITAGQPVLVKTPSESGQGQLMARCPDCQLALWSHYGGRNTLISFIRVGTLDHPDLAPPDIHIYTRSQQPWLSIPETAIQCEGYYRRDEHWPADSLQRFYSVIRQWQQENPS